MSLKGYYFRPRIWPTVMTIPIIVILVLLGNWQVDRLDWKLDLIQKLDERYGMPAVSLPETIQNSDDWFYRHARVKGRFLHMREMPLYSVGPSGRPGYDLFTPLVTRGGATIIINRGWVPEDLKEQASRPTTIRSGEVEITGVLRKSWEKEKFAPENDLEKNLWFYGDLEAMAGHQQLSDVFPMFLYADRSPVAGDYPVGGRTRVKLVNNHLDYAMTWYGLAIVLFIIYLIFNIRRDENAH